MEKKKINLKEVIILTLALLVLTGMVFLVYNQLEDMQRNREQLQEEEVALAQAQEELQELYRIRDQASLYQEQMVYYEGKIPQEPEEGKLLDYLQELEEKSTQKFIQVSFGDRQSGEELTEIPLEISSKGNYHSLLVLLEEMREGERVLRLDDLRIARGELPGDLMVEISACAFHRN